MRSKFVRLRFRFQISRIRIYTVNTIANDKFTIFFKGYSCKLSTYDQVNRSMHKIPQAT